MEQPPTSPLCPRWQGPREGPREGGREGRRREPEQGEGERGAGDTPSPSPPCAQEGMRFGRCLWCGALESQLVTRVVAGKENWRWMRENGTL